MSLLMRRSLYRSGVFLATEASRGLLSGPPRDCALPSSPPELRASHMGESSSSFHLYKLSMCVLQTPRFVRSLGHSTCGSEHSWLYRSGGD